MKRTTKPPENKFRSKFEQQLAMDLDKRSVDYSYEDLTLEFLQPQKKRKYTVDFILKGGKILVEAKGRFTLEDRQKMLWVKESHPELDIRMVFQNATNPIEKGSRTTYAAWCDKHNIPWAHGKIPEEWLQ